MNYSFHINHLNVICVQMRWNNFVAWILCCWGASIVWGVGPLTHAPHFRAAVSILDVSAAPRTPGVSRQQPVVGNVNSPSFRLLRYACLCLSTCKCPISRGHSLECSEPPPSRTAHSRALDSGTKLKNLGCLLYSNICIWDLCGTKKRADKWKDNADPSSLANE